MAFIFDAKSIWALEKENKRKAVWMRMILVSVVHFHTDDERYFKWRALDPRIESMKFFAQRRLNCLGLKLSSFYLH